MQPLTSRRMTEEDKRKICAWKYPGEYAIYNLPSYEEMRERKIGFLNPKTENNYLAFLDGERLVGFVNILEEDTEVFIGLGVAPDCCGRHYGRKILASADEISRERYPEKPMYLEVRTWNTRAVRCYEKAGFRIEGEPYELTTGIGKGTFYRMTKNDYANK